MNKFRYGCLLEVSSSEIYSDCFVAKSGLGHYNVTGRVTNDLICIKKREMMFEKIREQYGLVWEKTAGNTARILRVFGHNSVVCLPDRIGDTIIEEIGDYCFAASSRFENNAVFFSLVDKKGNLLEETKEMMPQEMAKTLRELSGKAVTKIELPKSITKIGDFAFYNCSLLEELSIYPSLVNVGSDAFMNCLSLEVICIFGDAEEESVLRQILTQRTSDTAVFFRTGDMIQAAVFYPEYYESYEEIGPAHIFELNLTGEGFRARQCFQGEVLDLLQYDTVFENAQKEESVRTLCKMALYRLAYPVKLQETCKENYKKYIREHIDTVFSQLIKERNLELLLFAAGEEIAAKEQFEEAIQMAAVAGWSEAVASLYALRSKKEESYVAQQYSFDDW